MSDEPKKTKSKIRTFAGDLDMHRQGKTASDKKYVPKEEGVEQSAPTKQIEKVKSNPKLTPIKENITVEKKSKEDSAKQIPSFHELQKKVNLIKTEPEKKQKKYKKHHKEAKQKKDSVKTNIGYDTTIITDNKKNRINLFSSIASGLKDWFKEVTKPRKKKTPKYIVPEASRRKGVIQKATTQTGSIFSADNETLKEKIRRRHLEESVEEEEDEYDLDTTWSPYTDTGFNLLESPDVTQNVKVEFKKSQRLVPVVKKENLPDSVKEEELNNSMKGLFDAREKLDTETPKQKPEPTTKPLQTEDSDETLPKETKVENKQESDTVKKSKTATPHRSIEKADTNTLTIITLVTIIVVVIIVISSRLVFQYINNDFVGESVLQNEIERVTTNTNLNTITLDENNVNNLTKLINSRTNSVETSTEIAFVAQTGEEVSPSYLFELLELSVEPTFIHSLTRVRLLVHKDSSKVLLLKFVDDTTIKGGFLNWETSISDDFSTLFNYQTDNINRFIDTQILNNDARELLSDDNTVIVYTLLKNNTALISSDKESIVKIIESEFSN